MVQSDIENIVNVFLEGKEFFLVNVQIRKGNLIDVIVDGDSGVTIKDCVKISRFIESNFDREQEDYELRVSSPGIDRPFVMKRQYKKYLEREIQLLTKEEKKLEGVLKSVTEEGVVLQIKAGKKGKELIMENLLFTDIAEAKPVISFKTQE
jgi:ribosome maturation factor RimP